MLTLRRRRHSDGKGPGLGDDIAPVTGSDAELWAEIERLTEANRRRHSLVRDSTLLRIRNAAGIRRLESAGPDPRYPEPAFAALPEGKGAPEVSPGDMTPEVLRAAILRDGCLLVRGLVPQAEAVRFARQIDRSFGERERYDAQARYDPCFYEPFAPDPRVGVDPGRHWIKSGGGVLAVDAPRLCCEMFEMFSRVGLPDLVAGYLGEPTLISGTQVDAAQGRAVRRRGMASRRQVHGRRQSPQPLAVVVPMRRRGPGAGPRPAPDRPPRHHPDGRGVARPRRLAAGGRGGRW